MDRDNINQIKIHRWRYWEWCNQYWDSK